MDRIECAAGHHLLVLVQCQMQRGAHGDYPNQLTDCKTRKCLTRSGTSILLKLASRGLAPLAFGIRQLLTYLRLTDCKLGLLINFNEVLIKDGIHRVVNGLKD